MYAAARLTCLLTLAVSVVTADSLETALERVSENYGVRIGLEYRLSPATSAEIRFPSHAPTGDAAVRQILKQAPGYRVRLEDGVLHVFDPGLATDRWNWLNMRVTERYAYADVLAATSTYLMQGVAERIRATKGGGRGGSFGGSPEEPRFQLRIHEGTVREYLNEVANVSRARMWVVRFPEQPVLTQAGYFETAEMALWRFASLRPVRGPLVVQHPIVLKQVQPTLSEEARRLKRAGSVTLSVEVDRAGAPQALRVLRPAGLGLDEKAIEALQQWRFRPASENGATVPMRTTIEIRFGQP